MVFSKDNPIPPKSVVKLLKSDKKTPAWKEDVNRTFRIGYYRKQDGLNVIWLVNDLGVYEQTTDQASLKDYFSVLKVSNESDLFGVNREALGPLLGGAR